MDFVQSLKAVLSDDFGSASIVAIGVLMLFLLLLKSQVRNVLSYRVECWFCQEHVPVNFFKRNSFTCPFCEQYNGFTEDGDYNKPMPAMHSRQLNQRRIHTEVVGQPPVTHNFLCEQCFANQASKIHQLAAFVPLSEASFDAEFREFKGHLEEIFQLCPPCLLRVNREIERQDLILGPNLMAHRLREKRRNKGQWVHPSNVLFILVTMGMRLATIFATYCLFRRDRIVRSGKIDDQDLWMKTIDRQESSVALAGLSLFVLSALLTGRERFKRIDGILLVLLLLLFLLSVPSESAFSVFSPEVSENKNCHYLVSAVNLAVVTCWAASHFISLIRSSKSKSVLPSQPVDDDDEDSIDGSFVSDTSSSDAEQEDKDAGQDPVPAREAEARYDPVPPGEAAASVPFDAPGPSDSRGPVRNSMGSLTLGPPGDAPKKRNDLWTSHISGSHTPPPPEMVGSRPVVHPARFNYLGGSPSGSAASSVVDGPTADSSTNSPAHTALRAQANLRAQYALRARQVSQKNAKRDDPDQESTSGIDGSSEELSSSGRSGSRRGRRRERDETRGGDKKKMPPKNDSGFSQIKSLAVAVLFGISVGLNISAALYFNISN